MSTLAIMKARVATDLARGSFLTTQIASAISDAITIYQKERFRFSDPNPTVPTTFATVASRAAYTSADNANISTLMNLDYVLVTVGSSLIPLQKDSPENLTIFNQVNSGSGPPHWYAYEGNQLILSPVPDQAYTVRLGAFLKVVAPAADEEANNPWMIDGERLIRSRAKYEIALHVTRNKDMQDAMSPLPPPGGLTRGHASYWAWRELKGEANRITSLGRIRSMQF